MICDQDPGINNFKDEYGLDNKEVKKLINEIYEKFSVCCDANQFEYNEKCVSPRISYMETDVNYAPPTPMSTDDLKDKLITDLDQERHDMIDALLESQKKASNMEYTLRNVWFDLCNSYEAKSSIKEVSKETLFGLYNQLKDYIDNCGDYGNRDLTKKIKKEIEQTKVNKIDCFDNF